MQNMLITTKIKIGKYFVKCNIMTDQVRANLVNLPKKFEFLTAPISRGSLRGLKRCSGCGQLNGVRSSVCRNEFCKLRKDALRTHIPLDPVQLECLDKQKSLYSLRKKEQNAQPRNFVLITARSKSDTSIFECYNCSPGVPSTADLCKHILACTTNSDSLQKAEVFTISRDVLWNLNGLDNEHKERLWNIYQIEESNVPAVQRISNSLFVVKCDLSKVFPAGRLHVTAVSNGSSTKKGIYSCSCKKLKIIVEPDNSVVMQEEVCDHILLVLAAVLSNRKGKTIFGNFASALKSYWMPTYIETPIVDSTQEDALFGLSIDIGGNFDLSGGTSQANDDIFIYNNDFMSDGNIPDFEDIILSNSTNPIAQLHNQTIMDNSIGTNSNTNHNDMLHPGDPNLGLNFAITAEDIEDIKFHDAPFINGVKALSSSTLPNNVTTAHLELSDCKIELMDQFELTDQIDLSTTDDITLQQEHTWLGNGISILEAPILNNTTPNDSCTNETTNVDTSHLTHATTIFNNNSLLKSNHVVEAPPIELPTIAVVKKCPVKASELAHSVNTRKFPPLPGKRSVIVNGVNTLEQHQTNEESVASHSEEPSLAFSSWLDYVIEVINESVGIVEERSVEHTFHVHEEIFAHFSKTFSTGVKLRMPSSTTVVKTGKYKGLIKYVWYFTNASTLRRIFSTKNISLETERVFEYNTDGEFVPYVTPAIVPATNGKYKRVYPKLSLYKTHIWFECGSSEHKNSFKLEWLPSAFPKSHHGILKLEFTVGVQDPEEMQRAIIGK
ncbi:uncharacterized protein LOC105219053 [Zeugodacus cucurbitae]|uniref:uncharacterized protein LOC105219053 n=1 Tax=Zeugodacus cucurbitae TaxID=28588 RepID=UPI0023D945F8|nr:uncharacterized protein LOC105219053 [Zeugodacus cucurbitae]